MRSPLWPIALTGLLASCAYDPGSGSSDAFADRFIESVVDSPADATAIADGPTNASDAASDSAATGNDGSTDARTNDAPTSARPVAKSLADELAETFGDVASPESFTRLGDDTSLRGWLAEPRSAEDLMLAAWARHPAIAASRARYVAAIHRYDQARYLDDTVSQYRAFTRLQRTRVGPPAAAGSKLPEAMLTPGPSIATLRQSLATLGADAAWHRHRAEIVRRFANVLDAIAVLRLATRLEAIANEHLALLEELEPVVRQRVSAGKGNQADILRVQAAAADQRREHRLRVDQRRHAITLLRAALAIDFDVAIRVSAIVDAASIPEQPALEKIARAASPARRIATIDAERRRVAVALAERVAIPRVDLGSASVERGMTGDAGAARGAMLTRDRPRVDLAASRRMPATALLQEMRVALTAAEAARSAAERDTDAAVSRARIDAVDAHERRRVHATDLVPLANRTYESLRRAYSGGRTSFIDVIRAAERKLHVARALCQAQRDALRADAAMLRATGHASAIERTRTNPGEQR